MSHNSTQLAALVGSRLCHDLISPVGAIQNGLELMQMSRVNPEAPEFKLVEDSCSHAIARIRYFRVAFGHAGESQQIGAQEIARMCNNYVQGSRLRIECNIEGDHDRPTVQLALLLVLCCETALPMGGEIRLSQEGLVWETTVSGPKLSPDPVLWRVLTHGGPIDTASPARVQFFLLRALCEDMGRKLEIMRDDEFLTVRIS
jgi:histidine phosphotransferase ChpT